MLDYHESLLNQFFFTSNRSGTVETMVDGLTLTKNGEIDQNELAKWVRQVSRNLTPPIESRIKPTLNPVFSFIPNRLQEWV